MPIDKQEPLSLKPDPRSGPSVQDILQTQRAMEYQFNVLRDMMTNLARLTRAVEDIRDIMAADFKQRHPKDSLEE